MVEHVRVFFAEGFGARGGRVRRAADRRKRLLGGPPRARLPQRRGQHPRARAYVT